LRGKLRQDLVGEFAIKADAIHESGPFDIQQADVLPILLEWIDNPMMKFFACPAECFEDRNGRDAIGETDFQRRIGADLVYELLKEFTLLKGRIGMQGKVSAIFRPNLFSFKNIKQ
jgi:hypothetical protein